MNPESLGWSAFFSDQLIKKNTKPNERPSRVIGISRTEVTLHDGNTEFKTNVGGKWFHKKGEEHPIVGDWVLVDPENKMTPTSIAMFLEPCLDSKIVDEIKNWMCDDEEHNEEVKKTARMCSMM